jgi:dTDP-4-dehydrorhamnose 3,5-epimerase
VRAEPSAIPGCVHVRLDRHEDARGDFVKVLRRDTYESLGLDPTVAELYWSTSHRGVVRGMHFQLPPHDHAKTVTVIRGCIHDVVVDLRVGSPAFGRSVAFTLDAAEPSAVHVPKGCAHGFQAVADESVVAYLVGTEHAPDHDTGVRWDTVGADWPLPDPVVSERDARFPRLAEFDSPFRFRGDA